LKNPVYDDLNVAYSSHNFTDILPVVSGVSYKDSDLSGSHFLSQEVTQQGPIFSQKVVENVGTYSRNTTRPWFA